MSLCVGDSVLLRINEDITLQSQKYSSVAVEAYDIIEVMWKHVYDYYASVRAILEVSICYELFNIYICYVCYVVLCFC
jgi:hypothetical protein